MSKMVTLPETVEARYSGLGSRFDGNPKYERPIMDLMVEKAGRLINIDSQAPNRVTEEAGGRWAGAGGSAPAGVAT